jgi:hypothetical protein
VIGNPDIRWEKALKHNYGLELGLFKDMILLNYDYFTEDRTDILLAGASRNIPPYFGATPPSANLGEVTSTGHEIELKFQKRTGSGFNYFATLAIAHNQNKVVFRDDPALYYAYQKAQGFALGQSRSQIRTKFYTNWDQIYASVPTETNDLAKIPGYYDLLDFNADGIIKADDSAPTSYSGVPQNTYNFSLGADYKGFSIMFQLYGVTNVSRSVALGNFNLYQDVVFENNRDYWSRDNLDAAAFLPRWKTQGQNIGDYWLFDASYLRLKTAEIAYSFQPKLLKSLGMSALRIFLNGNNLLYWSDLPEDKEGASQAGTDVAIYPTCRRINMGIELTF